MIDRHRLHLARTAVALLGGLLAAPLPAEGQCRVVGAADAHDRDRAVAGCERAHERFHLLYGGPPPAGTLEVSDTVSFFSVVSNFPEWRMLWPAGVAMREYFAAGGRTEAEVDREVELQWSAVLPHELAHLMLTAEVQRRRPANLEFRRLADWIHEGTAVWTEPPSYRADSYEILKALRPYVPTVEEILRFRIGPTGDEEEGGSTLLQTFYPCASEEACGGRPHWSRIFTVRTRQSADGRIQVDTIFHDRPPPPPDPLASNFYLYAATLVRFVHDQGGPRAMAALLDRFGRSADGAARLEGLPGLPASRSGVEAAWRAWFTRWIFAGELSSMPASLTHHELKGVVERRGELLGRVEPLGLLQSQRGAGDHRGEHLPC